MEWEKNASSFRNWWEHPLKLRYFRFSWKRLLQIVQKMKIEWNFRITSTKTKYTGPKENVIIHFKSLFSFYFLSILLCFPPFIYSFLVSFRLAMGQQFLFNSFLRTLTLNNFILLAVGNSCTKNWCKNTFYLTKLLNFQIDFSFHSSTSICSFCCLLCVNSIKNFADGHRFMWCNHTFLFSLILFFSFYLFTNCSITQLNKSLNVKKQDCNKNRMTIEHWIRMFICSYSFHSTLIMFDE